MPAGAQMFGGYRLVTRLGMGGMGETWRAVEEGPEGATRDVVIKRMLPSLLGDPELREAFVNEARLMMLLSHGNIVQALDFGEVRGEPFLALEFLEGEPLSRVLGRASEAGLKALPPLLVAHLGLEMLKGLAHAHGRVGPDGRPLEVVHRDISPDNVMIAHDGRVKLIDFGVAKARLDGRRATAPGLVKGKLRFFSPEQARAEPLDARSDLWSVGLTLYLALSGRYASARTEPARVLLELSTGRFPGLRVVAPWVPEPLAAVVSRALEVRREDRFPNARAFADALSAWLLHEASLDTEATVAAMMDALFRPDAPVPNDVRQLLESMRAPSAALAAPGPAQLAAASPQSTATATQPPVIARKGPVLFWLACFAIGVGGVVAASQLGKQPPPPPEVALPAAPVAIPRPRPRDVPSSPQEGPAVADEKALRDIEAKLKALNAKESTPRGAKGKPRSGMSQVKTATLSFILDMEGKFTLQVDDGPLMDITGADLQVPYGPHSLRLANRTGESILANIYFEAGERRTLSLRSLWEAERAGN